jgi:5'-nucleotidase
VPEIQQQGVAAIVLLIHEGGNYAGAANDPSYRCDGLKGPIIDIVKRLDKAIDMVISGHTHQGYTCKIDGRLVVQARSFGGYLTETTLTIDKQSKHVIAMEAVNHLVEQAHITPDAQAQILVDQVAQQTAVIRNRAVTTLAAPLTRKVGTGRFDHSLGNMVADAQLHAAAAFGGADISFMNEGGLRTDLPQGVSDQPIPLTFGDLYAVQPFGSQLVSIKMTGAQILSLLQQQWQGRAADNPKRLFVSQGFSYQWRASAPLEQRLSELKLHGQAIVASKEYTVVTNSFLAGGGDGFTVFKQGKEPVSLGRDIDATVAYLSQFGSQLKAVNIDRVHRID